VYLDQPTSSPTASVTGRKGTRARSDGASLCMLCHESADELRDTYPVYDDRGIVGLVHEHCLRSHELHTSDQENV